jgi:hypothetical protein
MSKKPKPFWLDRRIAADGPYLILCLREKDYLAAMKHLNVPVIGPWLLETKGATAHLCVRPNGDMAVVVCMRPEQRPLTEMLGMLVHEATHVWQHYAEQIGETNPGKEQEAYAIQAISQELMQSFLDQTKGGVYGKFKRSCPPVVVR